MYFPIKRVYIRALWCAATTEKIYAFLFDAEKHVEAVVCLQRDHHMSLGTYSIHNRFYKNH